MKSMRIQKCMPGLYPKKGLDYGCPISEKKVYSALEKALPKNLYSWHSLKVRTERFGMADECFSFVLPMLWEVSSLENLKIRT
jgi:hypothetical protein